MRDVTVGFGCAFGEVEPVIEIPCAVPEGERFLLLEGLGFEDGVAADGVGEVEGRGFGVGAVEGEGLDVVRLGEVEEALVLEDVAEVADGVGELEGIVELAIEGRGFLVVEVGCAEVLEVALGFAEGDEGLNEMLGVMGRAGFREGAGEEIAGLRQAMVEACFVALMEEGGWHGATLALGICD